MKYSRKSILSVLRVVIPFVTGVLILALITSIVYSGGKRENLAAIAESFLIGEAIKFSQAPAVTPGAAQSVSLLEPEFSNFQRAPRTILRDANITVYAKVLDFVLDQSPEMVLITWLHSAHYDDINYLRPLLDVIDKHDAKSTVYIAFATKHIVFVPTELLENYQVIQGSDCVYKINRYCSVPRDWDKWTPTLLATSLWENRKSYAVSYNLPHFYPNVILNLPDPDTVPDHSFSSVIHSKGSVLKGSRVVTIGNNVNQDELFKNNKYELLKTYIATSEPRRSLMQDGMPFHKFWALMAQMFIDDTSINVTPKPITIFLTLVVAAIIIVMLIKAGSSYALGTFLVTCFAYTMLNNLSFRYVNFYVPIFDVLYFSLIVTMLSIFSGISFSLYKQAVVNAERDGMAEQLDLKSNFLSLVTHNLNTPIAKLKGLFDVLKMQSVAKANSETVDFCVQKISSMQIAVKSVLLSTALEQNNAYARKLTFEQFKEDFVDNNKSVFGPLGFDIAFSDLDEGVVIELDPKFIHHCLLCVAVIHAKTPSKIEIFLSQENSGTIFEIKIYEPLQALRKSHFSYKICNRYIKEFSSQLGAILTHTDFGGHRLVKVRLPENW